MIPLDNEILVVESSDDIVIGFNGDSYRGMLRSVPSLFEYKRGKCWTLANVSFLPWPNAGHLPVSPVFRTPCMRPKHIIRSSAVLNVFVVQLSKVLMAPPHIPCRKKRTHPGLYLEEYNLTHVQSYMLCFSRSFPRQTHAIQE